MKFNKSKIPFALVGYEAGYWLFVSDVTAAMLDGKNNNLSLRWELNFIIMQIIPK